MPILFTMFLKTSPQTKGRVSIFLSFFERELLFQMLNNEKAIAFRQAALREQPDICKECWR